MREAHKRSRNPRVKKQYRVKNWSRYDKALRDRGDITVWFSPGAIAAWYPKHSGKPGRQRRYSDLAIETVLTLRLIFHLPLRQAEGFVRSLVTLMDLELRTPDHTTLSRRSSSLKPVLDYRACPTAPVHLIANVPTPQHRSFNPWRGSLVGLQAWKEEAAWLAEAACRSRWDGQPARHLAVQGDHPGCKPAAAPV